MAVPITLTAERADAGTPVPLFPLSGYLIASPDGQRFLVGLSRSQELRTTQLNVVLEWFKELDEKFAAQK